MKTAPLVLGIIIALSAAVAATPAEAKSAPDKITIAGPGLTVPIDLTDKAALAGFSPWSRGFIAWDRGLASEPADGGPSYTATFYFDPNGDGQLSPIYVLTYHPEAEGQPGEIYIPGPVDDGYRLNIGTIITGSSDHWNPNGQWQYATDPWDVAVRGAIRNAGADAHGAGNTAVIQESASGGTTWGDAIFSGIAVSAACAAWLWLRRKASGASVSE